MRDDELRSVLRQADRPRALAADEEAAILARLSEGSSAETVGESEPRVLSFERPDEPSGTPRSGLWLAIAACILVVVGVGVLSRSDGVENDAADPPVATTEACTVVGAEVVAVHDQWGSIRDWAIASVRPQPDLAEVTAEALRVVLADPDSSETLSELEALVGSVRSTSAEAIAEREALLDAALLELGVAVDSEPGLCAAPGLTELTN